MLPYPSPHRVCISQDPPQPNPTSSFPMAPAHLDQHYDHFFPSHGQRNSETLEAMLRPPRAAPDPAEVTTALPAPRNGVAAGGNARARKRPFRTDRHSKIRTAQGVRDRRMRLSLEVARDFFALQDRLGFDKASKTVDWLLTQSKPAIDRLSESSLRNAGGDTGMPSPTSAERCNRRLKEAMAAGSGKGEGDVEKVRARSGGSVLLEHGCGLNHVMSASMPGDYYYDYEEDGDFLDGMQY